ncbi:hypothetical protein [Fodinicola acaciae]|uniref:hypothetical protein n=1 Tax=Fodinicola acaciae TaxID=2681555 RepID=UPI0013D01A08|nr:hypothetical protein [Fodinicola acaciae]
MSIGDRPDALDHTWLHDLVDPDERVRARALDRQRAYVAAAVQARQWSNRVWRRAGRPAPAAPPHLHAEWDQAETDYHWHERRGFTGPIVAFLRSEPELDSTTYALLFLRWEAEFPQEWRTPEVNLWSPWTTKELVLARLGKVGVPDSLRPTAAGLVLAAIRRPYRCKDWLYARLVDHVVDATFRARVGRLVHETDPPVAARARFVLYVAAHPGRPLTRKSWRNWLLSGG